MSGRAAATHRDPVAGRMEQLEAANLELRRTLQMLEEARADLADQYDFAPIGFVSLDAKGCIREMNLTAARMLGRERSRLLTMPFFTQVAKPHCAAFLRHLRECRKCPGEVITEIELRVGRSGSLPVELRSVPVVDLRGGETVYRTAITDITERRRAEKALRESEERYRELVEHSPSGIFMVCDGEIVFANRTAVGLCGAEEPGELIGTAFTAWVRPAFQHAVRAALIGKADGEDQAAEMEVQLRGRAGPAVEAELVVRCFRHHGEPAMLVVARDIRRRRRAERQVLAISEREQTNFGREMHDGLCQSLLATAFFADDLRQALHDISPPAAAKAEEIASAVRRCAEEARNLAHGLCPVEMDASGLVTALHELTASVNDHARVGCTLECDDQLTIEDPGMATNVFRIAQEAVANALKHGNPKDIRIRLAADDGKGTLQVRDNGRGIPARPKLTGMGMHTMHYRATMIGGTLEIRRDAPRGTLVSCTFPIRGEFP